MDRRQALRNIGLGAGFLVATPTIISLLQSCTNEPEFIPVFLSPGEGHALRRMVDLIIPSDDTIPGAVDMGVHSFIDAFWNSTLPEEQQALVRLGFGKLADKFRSMHNKELADGKSEEFDALLSAYLKTDKKQQEAWNEDMGKFYQAYQEDNTVEPNIEATIFSLLNNIRGTTIWGWKTSEQIGKTVLWYDPVPGQQKGCIPLNEAGNGNAMAL